MNRRLTAALGILALFCTTLAYAGGDANKKAVATVQGEWKMVRANKGGKSVEDDKVNKTVLHFDGDKVDVVEDGKAKKESATYKIDASAEPWKFDLSPPQGNQTLEGLIKVDGNKMTIILSRPGGTRPTNLKAEITKDLMKLELEKVKK